MTDREKQIEEMSTIIYDWTRDCYDTVDKWLCKEISERLVSAGYGNLKEYQNEIDRLQTELAHREQDLVHADEAVSIREIAVKLEEDKIKKQAVKEFAEKLKILIHDDDFEQLCQDGAASENDVFRYIDNLITKLYGADANNEPYGYVYECVGFGVDSDSGKATVFLLGTNGYVMERVLTSIVFVSDNETR